MTDRPTDSSNAPGDAQSTAQSTGQSEGTPTRPTGPARNTPVASSTQEFIGIAYGVRRDPAASAPLGAPRRSELRWTLGWFIVLFAAVLVVAAGAQHLGGQRMWFVPEMSPIAPGPMDRPGQVLGSSDPERVGVVCVRTEFGPRCALVQQDDAGMVVVLPDLDPGMTITLPGNDDGIVADGWPGRDGFAPAPTLGEAPTPSTTLTS